MEWASAAIGVGGLLLAGWTVRATYIARRDPFQQRLYDRQADAYGAIVRTLSELHDDVQRAIARRPQGPLDPAQLGSQTTHAREAFINAYRQWRVFCTEEINSPIQRYVGVLSSATSRTDPKEMVDELNAAFGAVADAASAALHVQILSLETSGLVGQDGAGDERSGSRVNLAWDLYYQDTFKDFQPETEHSLRSATAHEPGAELSKVRDDAYTENRNLFLVHTWRPSLVEGQVADITIQVREHQKRQGPLSGTRPLTHGEVKTVEYFLGSSWFNGRSVMKSNAEEEFRLDISAYGSALCLARVTFNDGHTALLDRYLDFPDLRSVPTAAADSGAA